MKLGASSLLVTAFLLAACNGDDEPRRIEKSEQGREETRSIRNTEAVGYSGDAIADRVDSALDKSEERAEEMERAADDEP